MRISEALASVRTVLFPFEFFPPKDGDGLAPSF